MDVLLVEHDRFYCLVFHKRLRQRVQNAEGGRLPNDVAFIRDDRQTILQVVHVISDDPEFQSTDVSKGPAFEIADVRDALSLSRRIPGCVLKAQDEPLHHLGVADLGRLPSPTPLDNYGLSLEILLWEHCYDVLRQFTDPRRVSEAFEKPRR